MAASPCASLWRPCTTFMLGALTVHQPHVRTAPAYLHSIHRLCTPAKLLQSCLTYAPFHRLCVRAKLLQSCLTYTPFTGCAYLLSCFSPVWLFETQRAIAHQAPLSVGFSRQEHWSGLPYPPLGGLPDSQVEPLSLKFPALAGGLFTTSTTREALHRLYPHPALPKHPCSLEFSKYDSFHETNTCVR